jgi:hypothetical protein
MNQRDLIINVVLFALILGVAYFLVTFERPPMEPPKIPETTNGVEPGGPETPLRSTAGDRPSTRTMMLVKWDPFRVLVTPTPTPKPTTPPPPPPLPIGAVMGQFSLFMMDPPRKVTLLDKKTKQTLDWTVGKWRDIEFKGRTLRITLDKVDQGTFEAVFSAPINQEYKLRFF